MKKLVCLSMLAVALSAPHFASAQDYPEVAGITDAKITLQSN